MKGEAMDFILENLAVGNYEEAVEYVATRRPIMSILPYLITTIEDTKRQLAGT